MKILVINTGSSSIKYKLFDVDREREMASGVAERIGEDGSGISHKAVGDDGDLRQRRLDGPVEDHRRGLERIVDLLKPFSNFHYYDASQKDTASLKKVLPAITGRGYEDLGIGDGTLASIMYEQVTYGDATDEERARVRADLLEYCRQDTEGLIWIVEKLRKLANLHL